MNAAGTVPHQALLGRVASQLAATSTATDQLLLTRWRVLGLCQFLVGGGGGEAEEASLQALETFLCRGPGKATDAALQRAGSAVARTATTLAGSVLPQITPEKQDEVRHRLKEYEALGSASVDKAMAAIPRLRERLRRSPMGALLAGLRYRLELVATLVADAKRPAVERRRAASAILYLDEVYDAIPDTLGQIGLLDDDFALRLVLEQTEEFTEDKCLHWAERISALWDDLPFLRGVRLRHEKGPVATTWLDRVNSYVSYSHVLNVSEMPLILVQPSIACSPLHSIVSLIGLLVLDGLTSSRDFLESLRPGQIYEIDGQLYVRYRGPADWPDGWIRLELRDIARVVPPDVAKRMVPVASRHRLSTDREYSAHNPAREDGIIQRFFAWDEAIGAASLTSRVLLVTSRQRATELLGGIKSNGVSLLDDGLVRFAGISPSPGLVRSGLVLVVPTLAVARQLVDQGLAAHAIVVDGYERLHRGRHDLPFLLMRPSPPPVIAWSATGYYPDKPPSWLPQHRRLEVAADDLSYILELDGGLDDDAAPSRASLWEAATSSGIQKVCVPWTTEEQRILASVDELIRVVRSSEELPDYLKYHLFSSATTLRTLVAATPARWKDIKEFGRSWEAAFREQRDGLSRRAGEWIAPVVDAHEKIMADLSGVTSEQNSKADALLAFLGAASDEEWRVVCDRHEQVKVTDRLRRHHAASGIEPVLLRDLGVCKACIVVGWRSVSFGRRLAAHTPRRLVALVDETEAKRWDRLAAQPRGHDGESMLEAVGFVRPPAPVPPAPKRDVALDDELERTDGGQIEDADERRIPCTFIWLADEREGKVLARDSRVLVEVGDRAREKPAHRIISEERVILGAATGRWSPAHEFTQAVVEAMEASHPDLVRNVREWRRALRKLRDEHGWTTEQLRDRLLEVGVQRELQTLDGWLRLDQASPIGPLHIRKELEAMWPLLDGHTDRTADEVAEACGRLRSLRSAAGRALLKLWKGRTVDLGVDDAWLEDLVDRIRQEVQVHEVEAVTFGSVPEAMLGWWVTPDLAEKYEAEPSKHANSEGELESDDEGDDI